VIYAKAFFDLQLRFGHKVALLSGRPLARVLLEYTNFLERLERQASLDGLDRCFPFQALSVDAAAQDFYDFHGI